MMEWYNAVLNEINNLSNVIIALTSIVNLIIIIVLAARDKRQQEKILMFEKERRKSDIRPRFFEIKPLLRHAEVNISMTNHGGVAFVKKINFTVNPDNVTLKYFDTVVHTGDRLKVDFAKRPKSYHLNSPANNVSFEYEIVYQDIDENEYSEKHEVRPFNS